MSGQTLATVGAWTLVAIALAWIGGDLFAKGRRINRAKQAAWERQAAEDFNEHAESAMNLVVLDRPTLREWLEDRHMERIDREWAAINEKGWTA